MNIPRIKRFKSLAAGFVFGAVALFVTLSPMNRASAVPSFTRQTGQSCDGCHVNSFGPALTPYGRLFKLNGFVWGEGQTNLPPISGMVLGSYTTTAKSQPGGAAPHFGTNDNFALDAASLFYAGRIYEKLGAMVQATFTQFDRRFGMDNSDIRIANQGNLSGADLVYGLSVNTNPTVSDLWNSTPAWGYPFASSGLAPTPIASTLIEGALAQHVFGVNPYVMLDNTLYVELGGYAALGARTQTTLGVQPTGEQQVNGVSPYWRVTLQHDFGDHYASIGNFGLISSVFPGQVTQAGTDRYTDVGWDATYQFTGLQRHIFTVDASYIDERQKLLATQALGNSVNADEILRSFKANASYTFDKTYQVRASRFAVWGTTDTGLYAAAPITGSFTGSPNSAGYIAEVIYTPFGKADSLLAPWLNARFSVQYVAYTKFNGATTNYDGAGRRASDNNTLFLSAWFAF